MATLEFSNKGIDNIVPFLANKAEITFDYIGVAYSDSVTEVYSLLSGGSTGSTEATFTVIYTDSTKYRVSSIAQS